MESTQNAFMDQPDFRVSKFIQSTFNFLEDDISHKPETTKDIAPNDKTDQNHNNSQENEEVFIAGVKETENVTDATNKSGPDEDIIEPNHLISPDTVNKQLSDNNTNYSQAEQGHHDSDTERQSKVNDKHDVIDNQAQNTSQQKNRTTFRASAFIRNTFDFLDDENDDDGDVEPNETQQEFAGLNQLDCCVSTVSGSETVQTCDNINATDSDQDYKPKNIDIVSSEVGQNDGSESVKSSDSDMTKSKNKIICVSNKLCDISEESTHSEDNNEAVMRPKSKCVEPMSAQDSESVVMRAKSRNTGTSASQATEADDSDSDEDDGIYAESYRNSKWVYVGEDKDLDEMLKRASIQDTKNSSTMLSVDRTPDTPITPTSDNEVFQDALDGAAKDTDSGIQILASDGEAGCRSRAESTDGSPASIVANGNHDMLGKQRESCFCSDHINMNCVTQQQPKSPLEVRTSKHNRSDSISTTLSEQEFQRKYRTVTTRTVHRKSSVQKFTCVSEKFIDCEKEVLLKKTDGRDFGFHIKGNSPVLVSSVAKGSIAEENGLSPGDVIVTVNGVNSIQASHDEVCQLILQDPGMVMLEVTDNNGSFMSEAEDTDEPLCAGYLYKQGGTVFKNWKRRWFVLKHDNCLYYYKKQGEKDPLGAIMLTNYTITRAPEISRQYAFKAMKYGYRTYYFNAEKEEDMNRWAGIMAKTAQSATSTDAWMDISSHNVGLAALAIKNPDCFGYLTKMGNRRKTWKRRYCVLKDACLYYYLDLNSSTAQGIAHLHGYTVDEKIPTNKKFAFTLCPPESKMRTFCFIAESENEKQRWIEAMRQSIGRWIQAE